MSVGATDLVHPPCERLGSSELGLIERSTVLEPRREGPWELSNGIEIRRGGHVVGAFSELRLTF